jgi:dolichol kinase
MPFDRPLFFKELGRKAFHIGGCVIPAAYYYFVSREIMLVVLAACVLGAGFLEYMRLNGRDLYPTTFMRQSEGRPVGSYFYAALSMFLAVLLFDKAITAAAILFLIFGDSITGMAGALLLMYTGKKAIDVREKAQGSLIYAVTHPKPLPLMLLMFAICAAIGLAFRPELSYAAIAAGALGAVIADAFPWRIGGYTIDDNLSIPLVAGALMTLAVWPGMGIG